LRPWLYAIATNAARDFFRRRKNEVLEAEPAMNETVEPAMADPGLERAVKRALTALPEDQREAIVLHRFEGLSFAEVAEAVGASEAAVRVRAHRGYEKLRVSLKSVWEGEQ
jgi:RNA polymerase sigma-70 factor (ECF subfamily)